ncbi:MAG: SCO family protein [Gammaproteobacteria bacterium]|nr:SCO family protein [Gammaproteobacteria bacterium]
MSKHLIFLVLLTYSLNLSAFENAKQFNSVDLDYVLSNSSRANTFSFSFPEMNVLDHRNQSKQLSELFDKDKNVVFAFFFTHCVSICTTVTLSLKSIQHRLPENTQMVMISIDPETDTPDILSNYAKTHRIEDPNWFLLTGNKKQIIDLQKKFEAYRGNKMNHNTSLFVKKSSSEKIIEIKSDFSLIPQIFNKS